MSDCLETQLHVAEQRVKKAYESFAPGTGFGDHDAERQARMELESAKYEYERVKSDLQRRDTERLEMRFRRHQSLTAWLAVLAAFLGAIPGVIALLR